MKACLFIGPTLAPRELPTIDGFVFLPPVAQGDVYRIARCRPEAIGIVDGYFDGVPSVWHKEILWAMAEGIHLFGSASMGALRAAELHPFGMRGMGRIFEAYRDGVLEDDDEVAVTHGPAETGYLALSEAMVNIRRTLAAAEAAGIIGAASRDALLRIAKDLFYPDRTYERLLTVAAERSLAPEELASLRAWLPHGRIDQKREDALAMLDAMQRLLAGNPQPMRVDYVLEWTEAWEEAMATSAAFRAVGAGEDMAWIADERVLEELRLEADTCAAVRERALLRFLAAREADRRRQPVDARARRDALGNLRARHGLYTRAHLDHWLRRNAIDERRLERILEQEAQLENVGALAEAALRDRLLDQLRLQDDYARLADRAGSKQKVLALRGLDEPRLEDVGVVSAQLLAWYFEGRLARPIPDDIDVAARELGFQSGVHLSRALLREWLYCQATNRSPEGDDFRSGVKAR